MTPCTDRRVAFFYLLLRDKLVAGDVEVLIAEATQATAGGVLELPNEHLAALARDYWERLDEATPKPHGRTVEELVAIREAAATADNLHPVGVCRCSICWTGGLEGVRP